LYYDYNSAICSKTKPQKSSISKEVDSANWDVEFAPDPNDIYWLVVRQIVLNKTKLQI